MQLKPRSIWLLIIVFFLPGIHHLFAYEKQTDGVLFGINRQKETDPRWVKVQVCSENIIRILSTAENSFSTRASLMVDKTGWVPVPWSVIEKNDRVEISTSKVIVSVNPKNGAVAFTDPHGKPLLQEKEHEGKIITAAQVSGESTYHVQQLFDSPDDEAFYGLGEYQNAVMNYKGHDIDLWQYNIVDVNPFLVSSKNYGILWDNNSHTKFGDIREYQSLSTLRLYDKKGVAGGLTAEYFKDAGFDSLFTSRDEPRIEHEFIDVNDEYPAGFSQNVSAVCWSGEIESHETGFHKFRLYACGYTKMWLNGKLVVDAWRQNWLPWTHLLKLEMEAGKRYQIKIEWVHTGGYI